MNFRDHVHCDLGTAIVLLQMVIITLPRLAYSDLDICICSRNVVKCRFYPAHNVLRIFDWHGHSSYELGLESGVECEKRPVGNNTS